MKTRKKAKPARKAVHRKAHKRTLRSGARAGNSHRVSHARKRRQPPVKARYTAAVQAMQEAAASLAAEDLMDILTDLSWSSRAKWLSSYFADQLPEEVAADDGDAAHAIGDIGGQVAALLEAIDAARPDSFLNAVTCCFSADPAHVEAGLSWLQDNLGTETIDVDALEGLPGYQAVAEAMERVRDEASAD